MSAIHSGSRLFLPNDAAIPSYLEQFVFRLSITLSKLIVMSCVSFSPCVRLPRDICSELKFLCPLAGNFCKADIKNGQSESIEHHLMVSACARNRFGSEQQRTKRRRDSLQTDEPFAVIAEERLPAHIFCLLPGVDYNIRKALNCRVRNLMETDMAVYRRCFQMLRLQIRLRRGGRRDDNICSFGRHVQRFLRP